MGPFYSPPMGSCQLPIITYGPPLTVLVIQLAPKASGGPSNPDTMTSTTLDAIASSGGKITAVSYSEMHRLVAVIMVVCRSLTALQAMDATAYEAFV